MGQKVHLQKQLQRKHMQKRADLLGGAAAARGDNLDQVIRFWVESSGMIPAGISDTGCKESNKGDSQLLGLSNWEDGMAPSRGREEARICFTFCHTVEIPIRHPMNSGQQLSRSGWA